MRRLGIGAAAFVVATVAPAGGVAAAQSPATGTSVFCEAGQNLKEFFVGGVELSKPRAAAELRGRVEALADLAPRSLATAFPPLVRFYRAIETGRVTAVPRPDDRYRDAAEKAAPGSLRIARRLREQCGITLRG